MLEEYLDGAEKKYADIEAKLSAPGAASDQEAYRSLIKERRALAPVAEKYREYKKTAGELAQAQELAKSEDAELRALAEEDEETLKKRIVALTEEIQALLVPRDEDDGRSVVMEIRAGAGGEEAALFAAVLYRMYCMYAAEMGWKVESAGENPTGLGGFKEISFIVEGKDAFSRLKFESGVHRVQRVPVTEASGKIQTSTVTVAVLPEAEEVEVKINPADIKIDTIKSTGAGGQHINKTESAVRLTHLPTGIVIECQDERSQYKNRDRAMKILRTRLYDMKRQAQHDEIASTRRSQVGTGERSEKIRTYNYAQNRVTDHRIGKTIYSLDRFVNGDMGEMTDALMAADAAERLKNLKL